MAITELQSFDAEVVCLADAIVQPYENSDRRGQMRLSAEDVRWLRSARLKYGPEVRVIDISAGGIRVETTGELRPDSNVVFELAGPTNSILMPSRVLRCRLASLDEVVHYQGACAFKRPLTIPDLVQQAVALPPQPEAVAPRAAAPLTAAAATWQKVIARFRDGRLVRGYTNDFHPARPQLHLAAEPNSRDPLCLHLAQLKALFFVREFQGDPKRVDRHEFADTPHGRKVVVTFNDGEVLLGSTLGYRGEGNGFFVHPADARSNNLRVFVAPGSAKQVRFI
jgi:hypothetical protein